MYRGTSLIRDSPLLGPYSRPMPRAPWWSQGGGQFLASKLPLYSPEGLFVGNPRREALGSANAMPGLDEQGYLAHSKNTSP